MQYRFRFDDICINADLDNARALTGFLRERFPGCEIMWCISPLVFDMGADADPVTAQRIFPAILNAHSDHTRFFEVDQASVPPVPNDVRIASHGLVHVDHRLMSFEAQRLSILTSCSLVKSDVFVPPFNKFDGNTEAICEEYGIVLERFRDGWQCCEHEPWEPEVIKWYLHSRCWDVDRLRGWLCA